MAQNLGGPIYQTSPTYPGGGGSGVTPPFTFSKDGNCTVGTDLRTGVVPSRTAGQTIKGSNFIVQIEATSQSNVASTTRIQFSKRTAVSTWVDISGAYVDIAAGNYSGQNTGLSIAIGPDEEIGCYNASGSTLQNVVVNIYLIPQAG